MDDKKILTEAVVKDILALLQYENREALMFNRVADIAKMGSALCNSLGASAEGVHLTRLLEDSEYKAPHFHAALKDRAFRGESALRKKHEQLSALHTDIKLKMMGIQGAELEDKVAVAELKVQELRAEQEKLMNMALPVDTQVKALPKPRTRKKKEGL